MSPQNDHYLGALGAYKSRIINELIRNCQEVIEVIKPDALKISGEVEERGFFLKMAADYNRYLA